MSPDVTPPQIDQPETPIEQVTPETVNNAAPGAPAPGPQKRNRMVRFWRGYWRYGWWSIPLTIVCLCSIVAALPAVRYPLLADFGVTQHFTLTVLDSTTNTSVSGATVTFDGSHGTTTNTGSLTLIGTVGPQMIRIHKQYYGDKTVQLFIGLSRTHNHATVRLVATGRQVPLKVVNRITGQPIDNATIHILDTSAQTDTNGMATVVLPPSTAMQGASITANGYNEDDATVQVTSSVVSANTLQLTPSGSVYFLSDSNGTIDVVSTNLDGTNRQTVMAGTGTEDPNNTVLMSSHDWKYLALLSKRDGGQHAKLFLITPGSGESGVMDSDAADFLPIGWSGHYFIYEATLVNTPGWQSGQTVLRSYNADTGKITALDQTTALGDDTAYIYSYFGFAYIVNDRVVYGFGWNDFNSNYEPNNVGGQKVSLMSVMVDGSSRQDLRDIPISNGVTYASVTAVQPAPQAVSIQTAIGSQSNVYYTYQYQNNSISQSSTITDASFAQIQQAHTLYFVSPSGSTSVWSQSQGGNNTVFVGDGNGGNGTAILSQGTYTPYAWVGDGYIILEQSGNELDVVSTKGGTPLKISDYYYPANPGYASRIGGYGNA